MFELQNSQSQIQRAQPKPKGKYTGERISARKIQAIINSLSLGEPVDQIARRLKTSKHSIMAVRERESHDIARRKELIRASAARLAANGFDKLNREMDAGRINGALLVPVTGMATDKVIALSPPDQFSSSYQERLAIYLQPVDIAGQFNRMLRELEEKVKDRPLPANPTASTDPSPPALTEQSTDTEQ